MSGGRAGSRRSRTALLSAALVLAAAPAGAAVVTSKVIGEGVRLKGSRIWYAHGKAVAPRTVSARVVPTPAQRVKVQWAVVCQKSNPNDPAIHLGVKGTSGEASVRTAATVKLALPYPKPPNCVATVYATLTKDGKLELRLLQT